MKERPIIFSAPMVRAILEGRKTQERRVVKRQDEVVQFGDGVKLWNGFMGWESVSEAVRLCPHGAPGDRLWVREAHRYWWPDWEDPGAYPCSCRYKADETVIDLPVSWDEGEQFMTPEDAGLDKEPSKWRPSIFTPRWASRITLKITGVRVERLQAISEADAVAEGATMRPSCNGFRHANPGWSMDWSRVGEFSRFATAAQRGQKAPLTEGDISLTTARYAFANFFDRVHGRGFWDANPWVWVIEFNKLETTK